MPRLRLAHLPTPLEEAKALSQALGGPRILFKRDDLTGVGLGGNKVRKLEFIMARALAEGADTLIVCGGYQSNLARITAAMAKRAGLRVELVLGGVPGEPRLRQGNLLLDELMGASVTFVETVPRWDFGDSLEQVADKVRAQGHVPFIMPLGGSGPEGMAGYIFATLEMREQFAAQALKPDRLVVGIGSGGTYSGLSLGVLNTDIGYRLTGISVSRTRDYLLESIPLAARHGATELGLTNAPVAADLDIHDEYVGEGYGTLTPASAEAIRLVAQAEGVFLDPVYSGKAMAGLIGLIRRGHIGRDETVVFLHTGGQPALFAYAAESLLTGARP
ncbi:D-cysteine desulfhydrase family protein [Asticcacaulis benevestitus]|uniref:D-cysteine desulfhydrase family protein n=1 Tax=Asticcacaulis benevestitus TaxID=347481 RepID=UPI000475F7D2|nr:D-cysteine desulfhydrase family protein [Asticcacaulis benevestitus]